MSCGPVTRSSTYAPCRSSLLSARREHCLAGTLTTDFGGEGSLRRMFSGNPGMRTVPQGCRLYKDVCFLFLRFLCFMEDVVTYRKSGCGDERGRRIQQKVQQQIKRAFKKALANTFLVCSTYPRNIFFFQESVQPMKAKHLRWVIRHYNNGWALEFLWYCCQ